MSDLDRLAADLGRASARTVRDARAVLNSAAKRVQRDMAQEFGDIKGMKGLGRKVSYDLTGLSVEVGFDKGGVGNLANIAAFGGSRGGPYRNLNKPLDAEAPRFERAMGLLADRALGGGS